MAVYKGVAGIEKLQQKIILQHKKMVEEAIKSIALMIIDASPVGQRYYPAPRAGGFFLNDQGDFKNSWLIDYSGGRRVLRSADASGSGAWAEANNEAKKFNFQSTVYIYNSSPQAKHIEKEGWKQDDPLRQRLGWRVNKPPYQPVFKNKNNAFALLEKAILEAKGGR